MYPEFSNSISMTHHFSLFQIYDEESTNLFDMMIFVRFKHVRQLPFLTIQTKVQVIPIYTWSENAFKITCVDRCSLFE